MARVPRKPTAAERNRKTLERIRRKEIEPVASVAGTSSGSGLTHVFSGDRSSGSDTLAGSGDTLYCDNVYQDPESLYDLASGNYTVPEAGWYLISLDYKINGGLNGTIDFITTSGSAGGGRQEVVAGVDYQQITQLLYIDSAGSLVPRWSGGTGSGHTRSLQIGMLTAGGSGGGGGASHPVMVTGGDVLTAGTSATVTLTGGTSSAGDDPEGLWNPTTGEYTMPELGWYFFDTIVQLDNTRTDVEVSIPTDGPGLVIDAFVNSPNFRFNLSGLVHAGPGVAQVQVTAPGSGSVGCRFKLFSAAMVMAG